SSKTSMAVCDATSPASAPPTPSATAKMDRSSSARNESSLRGRRSLRPRSLSAEDLTLKAFESLLIPLPPALEEKQVYRAGVLLSLDRGHCDLKKPSTFQASQNS